MNGSSYSIDHIAASHQIYNNGDQISKIQTTILT